jgi:hypothetical protein
MNKSRKKKSLTVGLSLFFALALLFFSYGWITHRADCAVICSPIIAVTNYTQFSALLENLARSMMIGELKSNLSRKLSISYTPGNFMGSGDLAGINDFSSMVSGAVNEGLRSQIGIVTRDMSLASFTGGLNSAAMSILESELRRKGLDKNNVAAVLKNYQRFLTSAGIVGTYSGPVNEYQSMVSGFLPVASNLITHMTGLSGRIDVASSLPARQKDVAGNTRTALNACTVHLRDGLGLLGNIGNVTIADAIGARFAVSNSDHIKVMLGQPASGSTKVVLTEKDIGKIISLVNNAAAQSVPQYITRSANSLEKISLSMVSSVDTIMRTKVLSALEAINRSVNAEKQKEIAIANMYSSIENEVQGLLRDSRNYETFARANVPGSLFDDESMKKIIVLLASRRSSATRKKLAIKHYILARTSLEVASGIRARLKNVDPATIDSGYEDQAWKDLSRLHYYLLYLENQKLKLIAIQAMTQAADTDDPYVLRYIEDSGMPVD